MIRWVLHLPRGLGRTEHLIDLVKKHNGVLVTWNTRSAEILSQQYGLRTDQVCSYRQLPHWLRGREQRPIYIDDADLILADLLGVGAWSIDGVTLSTPDRDMMRRSGYSLPEKNAEEDVRKQLEMLKMTLPPPPAPIYIPMDPADVSGTVDLSKEGGELKNIPGKGGGSKSQKPRRKRKSFREDTQINEVGGFTPRKKVTKLKKARFEK